MSLKLLSLLCFGLCVVSLWAAFSLTSAWAGRLGLYLLASIFLGVAVYLRRKANTGG